MKISVFAPIFIIYTIIIAHIPIKIIIVNQILFVFYQWK
jgi:hypothetical protein